MKIQHTNINTKTVNDKEVEFGALKEQNDDLKTRLAVAKVEFEEMEIEKSKLVTEIIKNEDTIEDYIKGEKTLDERIRFVIKENEEMKSTIDEMTNDIEELEDKNEGLESAKRDLDDKLEELHRELFDWKQL